MASSLLQLSNSPQCYKENYNAKALFNINHSLQCLDANIWHSEKEKIYMLDVQKHFIAMGHNTHLIDLWEHLQNSSKYSRDDNWTHLHSLE